MKEEKSIYTSVLFFSNNKSSKKNPEFRANSAKLRINMLGKTLKKNKNIKSVIIIFGFFPLNFHYFKRQTKQIQINRILTIRVAAL